MVLIWAGPGSFYPTHLLSIAVSLFDMALSSAWVVVSSEGIRDMNESQTVHQHVNM